MLKRKLFIALVLIALTLTVIGVRFSQSLSGNGYLSKPVDMAGPVLPPVGPPPGGG